MSRVTRALRSPSFWIGLSTLILVALVLSVGAWREWAWSVRAVGVLAILLVAAIAFAIVAARAARGAKRIEDSMRTQSEQEAATARPSRRAEIQRLQEGLDAAIATIKQSKLGRGRRGRSALYALPWYVMIGPPAAGKTVAVMRSGLDFPLGVDRVRGVGGTRDCDWFFSDEAILLDTAGRYTTEPEDDEEWLAFLDMLRKHRPGEPVNGVVIGISIADLATMEADDLDHHAANVRRRVDELVRRLGVRFPVYLLFTKADLLQGFVEFFEPFSAEDREGPWGATLPLKGLPAGGARGAFEREFDVLVQSLSSTRAARLAEADGAEERRRSFQFPLEFGAVREPLARFVQGVFQPNPYQEQPLFRGFYFSSGTQEGAPLDPAARDIAQRFDLPTTPPRGFDPEMRTRSYFLRGLFREVVIPDAGLVQQTAKQAFRHRAAWIGAATLGLGLLVLLTAVTAASALRSRAVVAEVQAASRVAGSVSWDGEVSVGDLARVTGLRDQIVDLERRRDGQRRFGWGLYRGDALIKPAQRLYDQKVRTYAGRVLLRDLEQRVLGTITDAPAGEPVGAIGASSDLYSDLRAYLLMTSDATRLESDVEREFLGEHLLELATVPRGAADPDSVAGMVRRQVEGYVGALTERRVQPFVSKEPLVARARRLIYEPPTAERLYERIREAGQARFSPVTLAGALGGGGGDFFATNPSVNGFYSRRAFREFVGPAVVRWARSPDRVDWVMGYSASELPAEMRDQGALATSLKDRYFTDYAAAWTRFMKSLRLRPVGTSPSRAGRFLVILGDPNESPIVTALAAVATETRLGGAVGGALGERAGAVAERAAEGAVRRRLGRANRVVGPIDVDVPTEVRTPVDRAFATLHALAPDEVAEGGGNASLLRALQALSAVGAALEDVAGDADKTSAFFAEASRGGGPVADARSTVSSSLSSLDRDVRAALFLAPLRGLGGTLSGTRAGGPGGSAGGSGGAAGGGSGGSASAATMQAIREKWRTDVYRPFSATIAGKYPIDANARTEVPIAEFEAFFKPGTGTLDAFVTEALGPLGGPDGRAVPRALRNAIRDARRIQAGLFGADGLAFQFEVQPEVPDTEPGAPAPGQLYLEFAGTSLSYGMGSRRPWTPVAWPGTATSTLRVTTRSGSLPPIQFEGDWSVFRMLDRASMQRRSSTEFAARWPLERGVSARVNLRTRSATNPLGDVSEFFSFRPPSRL